MSGHSDPVMPAWKYTENSGSRIIWPGTMMPARKSSRMPPRPRNTITSSTKPAATPSSSISASAGKTATTLLPRYWPMLPVTQAST